MVILGESVDAAGATVREGDLWSVRGPRREARLDLSFDLEVTSRTERRTGAPRTARLTRSRSKGAAGLEGSGEIRVRGPFSGDPRDRARPSATWDATPVAKAGGVSRSTRRRIRTAPCVWTARARTSCSAEPTGAGRCALRSAGEGPPLEAEVQARDAVFGGVAAGVGACHPHCLRLRHGSVRPAGERGSTGRRSGSRFSSDRARPWRRAYCGAWRTVACASAHGSVRRGASRFETEIEVDVVAGGPDGRGSDGDRRPVGRGRVRARPRAPARPPRSRSRQSPRAAGSRASWTSTGARPGDRVPAASRTRGATCLSRGRRPSRRRLCADGRRQVLGEPAPSRTRALRRPRSTRRGHAHLPGRLPRGLLTRAAPDGERRPRASVRPRRRGAGAARPRLRRRGSALTEPVRLVSGEAEAAFRTASPPDAHVVAGRETWDAQPCARRRVLAIDARREACAAGGDRRVELLEGGKIRPGVDYSSTPTVDLVDRQRSCSPWSTSAPGPASRSTRSSCTSRGEIDS